MWAKAHFYNRFLNAHIEDYTDVFNGAIEE
jgi:hypothetical protein